MRFERKKNRLELADYFGRKRFFITTCCEGRREIFGHVEIAEEIVACLRAEADRFDFDVHAYCVMPEHVHFLAESRSDASNLIRFVKAFKQATGYACRARIRRPLWEKSFYDHILRSGDSVEGVAWYIWMNPVRKGLCREPREYPFSGSFILPWPSAEPSKLWTPPWKSEDGGLRRVGQVPASATKANR
jgi:putative transposase